MDENAQDTAPRSYIVIEFEEVGSVNVKKLNVQNVTPLQLLAIAGYLELSGKSQLAEAHNATMRQQEASTLIVPGK